LIDQLNAAVPLVAAGKVKVAAVPNCIDTEVYSPSSRSLAKEEVGAPKDVPLLLMMANLSPHKGQETAIRAVGELARRNRKVFLWLAGVDREGAGEFERSLRSLAADLGVADQVSFLGFRPDGPQLLRAADFFLLPSMREGLPLSILEAQATKVPVLAAPCCGIPEVVTDGETGFLIRQDDPIGYASILERVSQDRGLYDSVAERAYEQCIRYNNIETYCERIWMLYNTL
jgi:phosphatidylinositol alpha-1,6-mannosyltransferase